MFDRSVISLDIIDYISNNKEYLQDIITPYSKQYQLLIQNEDSILVSEITKQYFDTLNWILTKEIAKNTTFNTEDIFVFLESFSLGKYFNV